jgi:P27 family predicted phage terminase small subunit
MPNYRKLDARKKLAGTLRKDRVVRRPRPDALKSTPMAPQELTELARTEWQRLAPLVCASRTLAGTDLRALALLCETLATSTLAQQTLTRDGLTIAHEGHVRAHPCVKIVEAARAQATRLLIEFGLTPRARGHVEAAADATPDNPFARLS